MVGTCLVGETGVYLLGKLCPSPPAELGWGGKSALGHLEWEVSTGGQYLPLLSRHPVSGQLLTEGARI